MGNEKFLYEIIGKDKPDFKYDLVPEQVLLKMKVGEQAEFRSLKIELMSVSKSKIENVPFTFKIRWNGKNKKVLCWRNYILIGTLGRQRDWINQLLRDIEGVLILDKLNVYNRFHNPSAMSVIYNR